MPSFRDIAGVLRRQSLALVVLGVALIGAGMVVICPEQISLPYLPPSHNTVRLVRDDYDRSAYMARGSFVVIAGARPYRDVFSEYPQLATYLFAVPYGHVLVHRQNKDTYLAVFSAMMALSLGALAFVWLALAGEVGVREKRVLFLLLPGMLYFTLNRFDVVPELLAVSSLYLLVRKRATLAHAVLALGVLTKAYPLIYLPLFAIESWRQGGVRKAAMGLGTFAAVILAFSAQLVFWAGPTAIIAPFAYQLGKAGNEESLYEFLCWLMPWLAKAIGQIGRASCRERV